MKLPPAPLFLSLRIRLLMMMLLAALPAFAVIAYLAHERHELSNARYRETTLTLAQALAEEHAHNFDQARLLLATLAQYPELHEGSGCQLLTAVHAQAPRHIANLFIAAADGNVVCSARNPEKLTFVADMGWFQKSLLATGTRVGEYHISRRTGEPAIPLTHTLFKAGRPSTVLTAALDLSWLARQPYMAHLPPGVAYDVFDRHGNYLLRYPTPQSGMINIAHTTLWKKLSSLTQADTFFAVDPQGGTRLFAYVPLGPAQHPDARLLVGVPESLADSESRLILLYGLLALGAAMILGLAFGWLGGWGLLLRPMRPILETVRHVASGDLGARTGVVPGSDEINHLAVAVDAMADALQAREHDLQSSRDQLNSLMENIPGTAFRCETSYPWRIKHISQSVQQLTGWPATHFTSERSLYGELIHPDDLSRVEQAVATGIAERRVYAIEYRVKHTDGTWHWAYEQGRATYTADGSPRWLDGVILDISDRKRLEEEKTHLQNHLQQAQKMEALGQLTGGIAHDFNNILSSVLGFAKLALRRHTPDKNSELASFLREIITAGERARDLVAKMLAFGRNQPGQNAASLSPLPLIKEAVKMLSATIPASIRIDTFFEENLPDIAIDAVAFHQILVNLVINARDAIGEKGTITISLEQAQAEHVECAACRSVFSGQFVRLTVSDSGEGIPPNVLPRIFEPFFTTKEIGKGSGMGLAMVHGLVRRAGGHFQVESTPGHGTSFHIFFLPTYKAWQPEVIAPTAIPTPRTLGGQVLLVDDESAILRMLSATLAEAGWQVSSFDCPTFALETFRKTPDRFDAVITDLGMPEMSGIELAGALHALRPDLPIILCTGYNEPPSPQTESLHIRQQYVKPVDPETLLAALTRLVATQTEAPSSLSSQASRT